MGLFLAQPALDNCYVQIVDDWNWPFVRAGTMDAINEINLTIKFMAEFGPLWTTPIHPFRDRIVIGTMDIVWPFFQKGRKAE